MIISIVLGALAVILLGIAIDQHRHIKVLTNIIENLRKLK